MGGPIFNRPVEGKDDGERKFGVYGRSDSGFGVSGRSDRGEGVHGESSSGYGVFGHSTSVVGVLGSSATGQGVHGMSQEGYGVFGESNTTGVFGESITGYGVFGFSERRLGVYGRSERHIGVAAKSTTGTAIYGEGGSSAAALKGNVGIIGRLNKTAGSFKIDHPLDPANKYLYHSFVESPDMKNIYDGVVMLDDKGEAEISLPDWFAALNKDFRYQLTAIGAPGPNLYIAEEISETRTSKYSDSSSNNNDKSRFKIAGGTSGMKVSWQVTGIRQDPYAKAHPIQIEEDKPANERGYYLHPDLYSQPEEKGISNLLFSEDKREEVARAFHK